MKGFEEKNEVRTEDIVKLAEMYKRMTPANRFFMVSASGLLLASQDSAGAMREKQEVKAG